MSLHSFRQPHTLPCNRQLAASAFVGACLAGLLDQLGHFWIRGGLATRIVLVEPCTQMIISYTSHEAWRPALNPRPTKGWRPAHWWCTGPWPQAFSIWGLTPKQPVPPRSFLHNPQHGDYTKPAPLPLFSPRRLLSFRSLMILAG